jgi:photosystem II stability/assembly factor-like uncharacterized protein
MDRKLIFPVLTLMLVILACNVPTSTSTPTVTVIDTPTTPPLPVVSSPGIVTLHMLDENNGWAISETNVLRTSDGGVTWFNATPPGVTSLGWAVASLFENTNTGWVLASNSDTTTGTLYKTIDGGTTWVAAAVPFASGGLQFLDETNGWAITSLGAGTGSMAVAIFQTNDGGGSWTRVFVNDPTVAGSSDSLPLSGMKTGFSFLDTNHGWVGGMEPVDDLIYLYASSDGGVTWTLQDVSLPVGYSGIQTVVISPHFFDAAEGVLPVGLVADPSAIDIYITHDGGLTWSPSTPVESSGQVSIASLTEFFAWDGGPTLEISHDSGTTWESVTPNINIHDTFMTFQFVNAMTGWALTGDASKNYSLYKTVDGGSTWNTLIP